MKKGLITYILKRIILGFFGVVLTITISFFAIKIIPGNPFATFKRLGKEQMEQILKANGYDKPLIVQLLKNIKNSFLFRCISPVSGESVVERIFRKPEGFFSSPFFTSFKISVVTTIFSLFFGIIFGILISINNKYSKIVDNITTVFSTPMIATANVTVIFARLYIKKSDGIFMKLLLPSIIFSLPVIYYISQYIKELIIETSNSDYIKMFHLKGLNKKKIFFKHILATSLIPIIGQFFSIFVSFLSKTLFIESIFGIAGMGGQMTTLIYKREYEGIVFLIFFFSLLNIFFRIIDDVVLICLNPKSKIK